ncbi:MAG: hypothetical protein J6386_07355 [Candidatus Synoicihabitans palmerolidicus]|nr:hypothetical protein [Candidatus Synoicihabitans palmerolidicus]
MGTSPDGRIHILDKTGAVVTSVDLPVDSVLDLLPLEHEKTFLVATRNPGRIYRIDLTALLASQPDSDTSNKPIWSERGVSEFGAIRDRNVRNLALAPNGSILAGSSPSGNLYQFPAQGGSPTILVDQDRGEVTDIYVAPSGDVYVVESGSAAKNRIINTTNLSPEKNEDEKDASKPAPTIMEAATPDAFQGRSSLLVLPSDGGLPETVASRANLAIYRIVPFENVLLLPGGDDGELVDYDPVARRSLTFPGSDSVQLTDLRPWGGSAAPFSSSPTIPAD